MKILSISTILISSIILLIGISIKQDASALQKPSVARFIAIDRSFKSEGENPGDRSIIAQRILDTEGNIVGNSFVVCPLAAKEGVFGSGVRVCHGVFNLPKGKVTVYGSRRSRERYTLVVTGGSGFYSGVGGRLNGFVIGVKPFREKIIFHIQ